MPAVKSFVCWSSVSAVLLAPTVGLVPGRTGEVVDMDELRGKLRFVRSGRTTGAFLMSLMKPVTVPRTPPSRFSPMVSELAVG